MTRVFILFISILVMESMTIGRMAFFKENSERQITLEKSDSLELEPYQTSLKDYLTGKTNYEQDSSFVIVAAEYSSKKIYLRKEVYEAFLTMRKAAEEDGIELLVISGARNYQHQKYIWENKWNNRYAHLPPKARAQKILEYSLMPMTSRHHWGTEIDLNSLNPSFFKKGEGLKIYEWLVDNAGAYGFCQVYTQSNYKKHQGVKPEKWHWSYIPLSQPLLEKYNERIDYSDFQDFKGSEWAEELGIIEKYVNGVAPCL